MRVEGGRLIGSRPVYSGKARAEVDCGVSALQIAGPLIAVLFLTDVAFGLLNRVAPALNAFQLGFPAKIFLVLTLSGTAIAMLPRALDSLIDRAVSAVVQLTGG